MWLLFGLIGLFSGFFIGAFAQGEAIRGDVKSGYLVIKSKCYKLTEVKKE